MTKKLFISISLLISCLFLTNCSSPPTTTANNPKERGSSPVASISPNMTPVKGKVIPIGLAIAQTSNVALLGQEQVTGAKIAEEYFNSQGGIDGTPIQLILQDTGGEEAGAINAFQKLINQGQVVGIVGPTLSQQAFSADTIADRAKVPVLGPSNTAKGIPDIGDYVGRVSAPMSIVAPNSLKVALKQNPKIKKVAVFYAQNDAFCKSETETFQQAVKDAGLELVTIQKFQTTDTDFQSQATNGINSQADLIIVSGLAADGGNLVKQLRELGYKGIIVGGNGFNTSNLFPICQAQCDGILVAQAYSPSHSNQINRDFKTAYMSKRNIEPPQNSAQAFTGIQVFVEALREVNKQSKITAMPLPELRTKLNQQILRGKYDTPLGKISFTPTGEIIQQDFYVAQIKMNPDGKTGKFVFLK